MMIFFILTYNVFSQNYHNNDTKFSIINQFKDNYDVENISLYQKDTKNKINSLDGLEKFTNLETLEIKYHAINTKDNLEKLKENFELLAQAQIKKHQDTILKTVEFSHAKFDCSALEVLLPFKNSLQNLSLSFSQLTECFFDFSQFSKLQALNLDHNQLKSLKEINSSSLKRLDLSDNIFSKIDFIGPETKNIEFFYLQGPDLNIETNKNKLYGPIQNLDFLNPFIEKLKILDITFQSLGKDDSKKQVLSLLKKASNLQHLILSKNYFLTQNHFKELIDDNDQFILSNLIFLNLKGCININDSFNPHNNPMTLIKSYFRKKTLNTDSQLGYSSP